MSQALLQELYIHKLNLPTALLSPCTDEGLKYRVIKGLVEDCTIGRSGTDNVAPLFSSTMLPLINLKIFYRL